MKNYVIAVLAVVLGLIIFFNSRQKPPVVKPNPKETVAVQKVVELKKNLDSLQKVLREDTLGRRLLEKNNVELRKTAKVALALADTLQARYERAKTISGCDSTLFAKDYAVSKLGTIIENRDSTIKDMSHRENLYERIVLSKDSIIFAKDETIGFKDVTIQRLSCAQDWKFKHKFWAWFFGFDCDKK